MCTTHTHTLSTAGMDTAAAINENQCIPGVSCLFEYEKRTRSSSMIIRITETRVYGNFFRFYKNKFWMIWLQGGLSVARGTFRTCPCGWNRQFVSLYKEAWPTATIFLTNLREICVRIWIGWLVAMYIGHNKSPAAAASDTNQLELNENGLLRVSHPVASHLKLNSNLSTRAGQRYTPEPESVVTAACICVSRGLNAYHQN